MGVSAERIDIQLGADLTLVVTGEDGCYSVRMIREDRGRKVFLSPPTPLTFADLMAISDNLKAVARRNAKIVPEVFPGTEEVLEGRQLFETVAAGLNTKLHLPRAFREDTSVPSEARGIPDPNTQDFLFM